MNITFVYPKQVFVVEQKTAIKILRKSMYKLGKKVAVDLAKDGGTRDYSTLVAFVRKKPPVKTTPHPGPLKTDPDGKVELRDVDHSGKNQYLIGDIDSGKNSEYININATASTKDTSYNGVPPTKVSDTTLDKQNKPQFFHEKTNTYIKKDAVAVDLKATLELNTNPDYIKHTNRIKVEQNLP